MVGFQAVNRLSGAWVFSLMAGRDGIWRVAAHNQPP
jgi:hypothetical protein